MTQLDFIIALVVFIIVFKIYDSSVNANNRG